MVFPHFFVKKNKTVFLDFNKKRWDLYIQVNFVIFVNKKCLKAILSVKTKILFWNIYITLCNVVREAPDNIAQEKILRILRNVVLLLLGQHCTRQKPLQCCLRGSRQHCIRENLVQCFLNTLGTIQNKSKPYSLLSERIQTALQKKKKSCTMLF